MSNKIIEVAHVLPVLEGTDTFMLEINPFFTKLYGEPTLSYIGGGRDILASGELEEPIICAIRETSEETHQKLKIIDNLDFQYYQDETLEIDGIEGKIFHSELYRVYIKEAMFKIISQEENIWTGTIDDFLKLEFKSINNKNHFAQQIEKWLDF